MQAFPAGIILAPSARATAPRRPSLATEATWSSWSTSRSGWPADGDPEELARLTAAERARGAELGAAGTIRRMWRVPGRRANWGVWEADDATALHAAIASLPLFP